MLLLWALAGCAASPATKAVALGDVEATRKLLDSGTDPNSTDRRGRPMLEVAILKQQAAVAVLLVERGADIEAKSGYQRTPLQWTAERGTVSIARALIDKGADLNVPGPAGAPPLIEAIWRKQYDVAALLIDRGADLNLTEARRHRGTALHAAVTRDRPFLVRKLLAAGADPGKLDGNNQTPAALASRLGRRGEVQLALNEGAAAAVAHVARREAMNPAPAAQPKPSRKAPVRRDKDPPVIKGPKSLKTDEAWVNLDLKVSDESAVTDARIDGRVVALDADGKVKVRRTVPEGNSVILFTAVDEWGNEADHEIRVARTTTRAAMKTASAPSPSKARTPAVPDYDFGKYYALVIGNNDYQHLPRLRTAGNDAATVSATLKDDYGYEVETLLDATRADILQAFSDFRGRLTKQDNLLIYYAGHGWLDTEADEGYWLPVDATQADTVNWISNATISSSVRAIQAKHVLVVADSCYSGKMTRGIAMNQKTPHYLDRLAKKRARVVLTSGGLEPVEDGSGEHSIFAKAFIEALRQNDGVLEGHALFMRIRRPIALGSDQVPEYSDMRKAGHDGGDFLFVRAN